MNTPDLQGQRLVTDAPIRVFHGLFALGFAGAWLSGDADDWRALHVALGYSLAGLLAWRLVYGLIGPPQARLRLTVRRLASFRGWLLGLQARMSADGQGAQSGYWRQGQNLLMALLPTCLLLGLPLVALSGLASYQDWAGLGEASEEVHEFLANALGTLALLHPALVLLLSLLRRRNQAGSMWSGRVPGPGPDLVRHERKAWALLLALAVLLGAWMLWQAEQDRVPAAGDSAPWRGRQDREDDD